MAEQQWLSLAEILKELEMDRRTFRANVEAGIFPEGSTTLGEKHPRWNAEDLGWMKYRRRHYRAFRVTFCEKTRENAAREK